MMKLRFHVAAAALVAFPFSAGAAVAQDGVEFDFKTTQMGSTGGQSVNGASTGHAVASNGRIRVDTKGGGRGMTMPGMDPSDDMSVIVLDSGKTFIYLQTHSKQYMRFNPVEAVDQMQKIMESMGAGMKFEFVGDPKLEEMGSTRTVQEVTAIRKTTAADDLSLCPRITKT